VYIVIEHIDLYGGIPHTLQLRTTTRKCECLRKISVFD